MAVKCVIIADCKYVRPGPGPWRLLTILWEVSLKQFSGLLFRLSNQDRNRAIKECDMNSRTIS